MNEALPSGLPVIIPDCSPNNDVLPTHWLIPATMTGSFTARTEIDLHEADPRALGAPLDQLAGQSNDELIQRNAEAYALGYESFSMQP
jgi:hypothetical protein